MYFEEEPFTGNASSKKEDFSIMTDYKDGKVISSRSWNKYGILTKEPTMNGGTKEPVLVAWEEPKQHEELTRKQAEEKQKQNKELAGKQAEVERKRNEELARKRAEVEQKQHEELARKHAEESVKTTQKTIDFDDPGTRRKIAESAIYKNQSQQRGNKGEELLYFRDKPYSGWWKEMRGKGNGYSFETLVQYKDGKRDGPMAHWYKNGQKNLEHTYKDDKKHGLSRGWYNNGKKWWEETCKDGKWDGLRTNWYNNGLKKLENTYKDGRLHGLARGWYRNGNKRRERTYKDGELMSIVDWKPDGEKLSGSKLVSIIRTGNVKDAGSDGLVMHAHIIGLDESRSSLGRLDNIDVNDRKAGATDVYSLPFNYPVAEIQGVELVVVKGNDAWRAETISFQFFDGGKKSKPNAFEVNQWFSAEKKDLNSFGAIKSKKFSFRPDFEANQSPAPEPVAE